MGGAGGGSLPGRFDRPRVVTLARRPTEMN